MKTSVLRLVVLLLLVVLMERGILLSFSQPSYTVNIAISKPSATNLWDSQANLTFTVAGLGDFLNATVQVRSQTAALLLNSFYLRGFYVGTNGVVYQWLDEYPRLSSGEKVAAAQYAFRGINCEWIDYDVCAHYSGSSTISIVGNLMLDSSSTNPGSYTIEVTFTAHAAGTDYRFSNGSSYEVRDFWTAHVFDLSVMLTIVVLTSLAALTLRRSIRLRTRNQTQDLGLCYIPALCALIR